MTTSIDRGFDLLALLRVEENHTPFTIKAKGMWGQISVPLGTDLTPVSGLVTTGRDGKFAVLLYRV